MKLDYFFNQIVKACFYIFEPGVTIIDISAFLLITILKSIKYFTFFRNIYALTFLLDSFLTLNIPFFFNV